MFVLSLLRDKIQIPSTAIEKEKVIVSRINEKYSNKYVKGLGLGVCVYSLEKIHYYKVEGEFLGTMVDFKIIFIRYYNDEIIHGKISKQTSEGIEIESNFFEKIFVSKENMFKRFDVAIIENNGIQSFHWFWKYKGHNLYFKNNDVVRAKIKIKNNNVEARINENGLGPIKWWE